MRFSWVTFLLCGLCLQTFQARAERPDLRALLKNKQGQDLYQKELPSEALAKWIQALESSPETPELHLNIGKAFEALGDSEKALAAYRAAERLSDGPEIQFLSRFNQGALYQKGKKVDEALKAYLLALEVNPTSQETKINIELLIQQQQQDQKQKGGQGESQDQKDQENKDQKDQNQDQKESDSKDQKDQKDQGEKEKEQEKPKSYSNKKPQPRPFKSEELTPSDVNKILGELRNQEQRIRAEFNKREVKERPKDKDW